MLRPDTYTLYLETLVVSLIAERHSEKDIICVDEQAPGFAKGYDFSVYNVQHEIDLHRKERQ